MSRVQISLDAIVAEIGGSPDGVGYDVSLTKIYDEIKDARFEEDHSVSLGVWERELKRADWGLAEKLAFEALVEKSKDLQIAGWLIEALAVLDGFDGILNGVQILTKFVEVFWEKGYPKTEDLQSDEEQKFRILEWVYDAIAQASKFVSFASGGGEGVNIYQYDYAVELRNTVAKAKTAASRIMENAQKNGVKTVEDISNIVSNASASDISKLRETIEAISGAIDEFKNMLSEASGTQASGVFHGLLGNLKKIENVMTYNRKAQSGGDKVHIIPPQSGDEFGIDFDSRDAIYDKVDAIAKRLAVIERHSPSSYILSLVVSWKHKNLLEIMDDLKTGNSESHRLLKSLIS
ncbi:MAG: type VI secretion system ImpA family N-terminal domain-containing protein [Holosporales bacterium]|jgi:type VI secretion system ImpA family protein|nr:type VI secretion system ImpA family N-terminal domain-containing protein [Holosporales bacterium]